MYVDNPSDGSYEASQELYSAEVGVRDNDGPPLSVAPAFSIADAMAYESDGSIRFDVTLDSPVPPGAGPMTVDYQTLTWAGGAKQGEDFEDKHGTLTFYEGESWKEIEITIIEDQHDEGAEDFRVYLWNARGGARIADHSATGTITNSDPMPAAWLARFGRTAAEQALDGIAGRIAASRLAGVQGTIAGQGLNLDPGSTGSQFETGGGSDGSGGSTPGTPSGNDLLAQSEALLGSSFTATGEKDGTGGSLAFWGRAAQSSFDGREEGTFSLDGEATTAMLGADYARGNGLVGMALMQSSGEGGYRDTDHDENVCNRPDLDDIDPRARKDLCDCAIRDGDGEVEATLTAALPYAAIQASKRLKLWGALGYGTGEVTLKPEVGGSLTADISWTMAAAGLRGDVIAPPAEGSGPALAMTSDALWARTSSDKTHELAASDSDVTRLRLGLEGSWRAALAGGGHVTPKLEAGMRHDGGDAETGFGVEVGGGLTWVDPTLGLSFDLSGRSLIAHGSGRSLIAHGSGRSLIAHGSDDLENWGFAASLAFDPDPVSDRGLSLALRQEMGGQAKGGLNALFRANPLEDRTGSGETDARWTAEAAYGFPAFSGRFTGSPHVGLGLATAARVYSLGWRLTPAANANTPDTSFGVRATRRESDGTVPEHTVGFEINARW